MPDPSKSAGYSSNAQFMLNESPQLQDMRKVIAAFNMTLDGICDHTVGIPDEAIHHHYTELLTDGGVLLYGRTSYQLMQFWQTLRTNPSGQKSMDDFALAIDSIPKIVFSRTLKNTGWDTARLATQELEQVVAALKRQPASDKDILVGSRSLIIQLINLNLIDELQICIYPMLEGKGLPLFDEVKDRTMLRLLKTKTMGSGAIVLYYEAIRQ